MKRATAAVTGLVAVLILFAAMGEAATVVGVAPSRFAFDLQAGEVRVFTIAYDNQGEDALSVSVYAMDLLRRADGVVVHVEPEGPLSGASWVRVEPAAFVAPPRSRTLVTVTVEVPRDIPDGEYHAVVFFEAAPPEGPGTLRLGARIGSVLYMAVGQDLVRKAALVPYGQARAPLETGGHFLARLASLLREHFRSVMVADRHVAPAATGRPLRIFVPVANLGTIHIRPEGRVRVTAAGRQEELRHLGEVILPGDARVLEFVWDEAPFIGVVRVEVEVEYGGEEALQATSRTFTLPLDLLAGLALIVVGLRLFGIRGITIHRAPRRGGTRVPAG